jgi:hypothetical protein
MVAQADQFHALLFSRSGGHARTCTGTMFSLDQASELPNRFGIYDIHSKHELREDAVRKMSLLFHLSQYRARCTRAVAPALASEGRMICSQHKLAQTHRSISSIQDGSVSLLYPRKCLYQAQSHAEPTTSRTQTPGKVSGSQKSRPVAERFGCGSAARIARK